MALRSQEIAQFWKQTARPHPRSRTPPSPVWGHCVHWEWCGYMNLFHPKHRPHTKRTPASLDPITEQLQLRVLKDNTKNTLPLKHITVPETYSMLYISNLTYSSGWFLLHILSHHPKRCVEISQCHVFCLQGGLRVRRPLDPRVRCSKTRGLSVQLSVFFRLYYCYCTVWTTKVTVPLIQKHVSEELSKQLRIVLVPCSPLTPCSHRREGALHFFVFCILSAIYLFYLRYVLIA